MNILFLYWGKKGGGAKYSLEISRELAKSSDVNLFLSLSTYCEISDRFEELHTPILKIDTYASAFQFIYQYLKGIKAIERRLENYIRVNQIDVVIIGMDFFWGSNIHKACRRAGAHSILVVHEPTPHPREPLLMSIVKKRELKKSIQTVDHVVALTDHVKKMILDQYQIDQSSVSVIPHGIFSYYKAPSKKSLSPDEEITILYFGRIEYYKGLDILLDAFLLLEQSDHPLKLEIWGSGDLSGYEEKIEKVDRIQVENGWIDEEKIPEIFQKADICVLPYRDASQSGIVGIASLAGVPIVATPTTGLKEQLKDTDVIFADDFTPQSLALAIENLINDPDLYSYISASEIEYANRLDWSSIAKQFLHICDSVTDEQM